MMVHDAAMHLIQLFFILARCKIAALYAVKLEESNGLELLGINSKRSWNWRINLIYSNNQNNVYQTHIFRHVKTTWGVEELSTNTMITLREFAKHSNK